MQYTDFYDEVMAEAPKCPLPIGLIAIKRAVIEFCQDSAYVQAEQDPVDIFANTGTYTAAPGAEDGSKQVNDILAVLVGGVQIDPYTSHQLDSMLSDWRTQTGNTFGYLQTAQDRVRLVRTPSADLTGGLIFRVAYAPIFAASTCPDELSQWHESIANGAKAKLMLQAGKPWSNPGAGMGYQQDFMQAIGEAKLIASRQFSRVPLRTSPA